MGVIPEQATEIDVQVNQFRPRLYGHFKISDHAFEDWSRSALRKSEDVYSFLLANGSFQQVDDPSWQVFDFNKTVGSFSRVRIAFQSSTGICLLCGF